MNTVNLEEKLKLAKKMKLTHQVSQLEYRRDMFELTFKPITLESVRKRLTFRRFHLEAGSIICHGLVLIACVGLGINDRCMGLLAAGFSGLTILSFVLNGIKKTFVMNCPVEKYTNEEIPYGALLAMDEAKKKKITNHRIYWPEWENSLATDPIIVGTRAGKLFEIYAWNENDVYEAKA